MISIENSKKKSFLRFVNFTPKRGVFMELELTLLRALVRHLDVFVSAATRIAEKGVCRSDAAASLSVA